MHLVYYIARRVRTFHIIGDPLESRGHDLVANVNTILELCKVAPATICMSGKLILWSGSQKFSKSPCNAKTSLGQQFPSGRWSCPVATWFLISGRESGERKAYTGQHSISFMEQHEPGAADMLILMTWMVCIDKYLPRALHPKKQSWSMGL